MIKNIKIENFRGHKLLEMNNTTPITLVTGKNNVGKSSLLEALFLLHDHGSANVFALLSSLRGGLIEPVVKLWDSIFYKMDLEGKISIEIVGEHGEVKKIVYEKNMDYAPDVSLINAIGQVQPQYQNIVIDQQPLLKRLPYSLKYIYNHEEYEETGNFVANQSGIYADIRTSLQNNEREMLPWTVYINPITPRIAQEVMEWIGDLEINEKKDTVVEILNYIAPGTKDVFVVSKNGQTQLYIKNTTGIFPIKYAGDGVIKLLYIIAAIMTNKNSLLLIDEIENGFHYSMYSKIWEVISKSLKDNHCQLFASTHSYEHILGCVEGVKKSGCEDNFSLHRLEKNENLTKDFNYDFEMAEMALKSKIEVR